MCVCIYVYVHTSQILKLRLPCKCTCAHSPTMAFLPVWSTDHLLGEWGGRAWESPTLGVVGRWGLPTLRQWQACTLLSFHPSFHFSFILNSLSFSMLLDLKDIVICECQTEFDLV